MIPGQEDRWLDSLAAQPPELGAGTSYPDELQWQRVYEDTLRAMRTIPDPAKFAECMEPVHRETLIKAWPSRDGWRIGPQHLHAFRLMGLAEVGGIGRDNAHERNHLTAFGMKVRRAAIEAEQ